MRTACLAALCLALAGTATAQDREPAGDPGFTPAPAQGGALVRAVRPNSTGSDLGLEPGDLIIEADGKPVASMRDLIGAFTGKPWFKGDVMKLKVKRGDEVLALEAPMRGVEAKTVLGSKAPPWRFKRWGNVPEGQQPPSLESLQGKVIVLFAFQST